MTDCTLSAPATAARRTRTARHHPRLPHGIPLWARLLGVTVVPLEPHDPRAPRAWVISAGAGTGHIAAVFHDGLESEHP
jgi:hypothetical protein